MPRWKFSEKTSLSNGRINIRVGLDLSGMPAAIARGQRRLGEAVLTSCKAFMPLLTGSLQRRSYVDGGGKKVVFPGPYGQYQYGGKVMVDSATGKGPALIHDKDGGVVGYRFRKGAKLKATDRPLKYSQPNARARWLEPAKKRDLNVWIDETRKAIGGG